MALRTALKSSRLFLALLLTGVALAGCGGTDQPEGLTGNPDTDDEEGYVHEWTEGNGQSQPPVPTAPVSGVNTAANGGAPPIVNPGGAQGGATTPANVPPIAPPVSPPTTATALEESAADRAAAEWVLNAGGRVGIDPTKPAAWLRPGGVLPTSPFRVLRIDLHDCGLDNQSLAQLSGLEQLSELDLSETALSDAQLAEITAAPALMSIALADSGLTDVGAQHLQTFKALKKIELPSGVSDAVITELQAALPGCAVSK